MKPDFEKSVTYHEESDVLIPNLALPNESEKYYIGVWGQRHRRYLKEHHRILYYNLLTACKLNSYLADIDRQAEELFFRQVKQMAEREDVAETLKAQDQMAWMQAMNNIHNRAAEVVYNDLIYN